MSAQSLVPSEKSSPMKKFLSPYIERSGVPRKIGLKDNSYSSFMKQIGEKEFNKKIDGWDIKTHQLISQKNSVDDKYSSKTHSTMTQDAAKLANHNISMQSSPIQAPDDREAEKRKKALFQTSNYLKKKETTSCKTGAKQFTLLDSTLKGSFAERGHAAPAKKSPAIPQEAKKEPTGLKKITNPPAKHASSKLTIADILSKKPVQRPAMASSSESHTQHMSSEVLLHPRSPDLLHFDLTCKARQKSMERPVKPDKSSTLAIADCAVSGTGTQSKPTACAGSLRALIRAIDPPHKTAKLGAFSGISNRRVAANLSADSDPLPKIVEEITDHGTYPGDVAGLDDSCRSTALLVTKPQLLRSPLVGNGLLPREPKFESLSLTLRKKDPSSFVYSSIKSRDKHSQSKPTYFMSPSKLMDPENTAHLMHLTKSYEDSRKNRLQISSVQQFIRPEDKKVDFPLSSPPKKLMLLLDLDETLIHCDPRNETQQSGQHREVSIQWEYDLVKVTGE